MSLETEERGTASSQGAIDVYFDFVSPYGWIAAEMIGALVRGFQGKELGQGVYQIVARGSTSSSDYGEYDTSSIDKTARVAAHSDVGVIELMPVADAK